VVGCRAPLARQAVTICPYCGNELEYINSVSSRFFRWWEMNGSEQDAVTETHFCKRCKLNIDLTLPVTVYPVEPDEEE